MSIFQGKQDLGRHILLWALTSHLILSRKDLSPALLRTSWISPSQPSASAFSFIKRKRTIY